MSINVYTWMSRELISALTFGFNCIYFSFFLSFRAKTKLWKDHIEKRLVHYQVWMQNLPKRHFFVLIVRNSSFDMWTRLMEESCMQQKIVIRHRLPDDWVGLLNDKQIFVHIFGMKTVLSDVSNNRKARCKNMGTSLIYLIYTSNYILL